VNNIPTDWHERIREHRGDCATLCELPIYRLHESEEPTCIDGHESHDVCDCDERDIAGMEAAIEARAEAYDERGWID
jgi:hypothetical protein